MNLQKQSRLKVFSRYPSVATNAQPFVESFLLALHQNRCSVDAEGVIRDRRSPYVYAIEADNEGTLVVFIVTSKFPIGTAR